MVVRGLRSSEHNMGQILRAGGKVYKMGGRLVSAGGRRSLAGNLSTEAADQSSGLALHPFMTPAHGLAVPEDFLSISPIQIQQAVGHEDRGECDEKCEQADIYPGKSHDIPLESCSGNLSLL